jgi:biotin carboxyl carrier protein
MRKFIINVNGQSYEVEVEEIVSNESAVQTQKMDNLEKNTVEKELPKKESKIEVTTSKDQESIEAPMPGNIWKLVAKEGQQVKAGEVILILEAMKMENEIVAPRDGKLVKILVNEGNSVNTGDKLAIIE